MSDKVSVEINRIVLEDVAIKDLSELEITLTANQVAERMRELEKETEMVDTLKLALLAAMTFAAESFLKTQTADAERHELSKSVDDMTARLQETLAKSQ